MSEVLPPNHWLFQLANLFLLLSYLATSILVLRTVLLGAGLCFALWGGLVLNVSVDTVVWNAVFVVLNAAQIARLLAERRPVSFGDDLLETVYREKFGAGHYNLSRRDFLALAKESKYVALAVGEDYVVPGDTAERLALLVEGEARVTARDRDGVRHTLNTLRPYSFLDSPQWIARRAVGGDTFLVSITATRLCRLVYWDTASLGRAFAGNPRLEPCVDYLCGLDVAQKLFRMDRSVFGSSSRAADDGGGGGDDEADSAGSVQMVDVYRGNFDVMAKGRSSVAGGSGTPAFVVSSIT